MWNPTSRERPALQLGGPQWGRARPRRGPLLWMSAACVDAAMATSIGFTYCAFRSFYGFAYMYYGGFSMLVEFVTQPNYAAITVLAASVLSFGLGGPSIFELPVLGTSFLLWLCEW